MTEYIERDYVLKLLGVFNDRVHGDYHFMNGIETAKEIVEDAPSTDVQPVKHGKWEEVQEWMGDVEYSCSVCGCYALWKELTTDQVCTEYCPHCGAKMDGET